MNLVNTTNGVEFVISPEAVADTTDHNDHEILPYESRSFTYYFNIPTDAKDGGYDLVCSFRDTNETFSDVFTINK